MSEPIENGLTLEQAAALVPGRNGHIHRNTILRWIKHGFRGVKLHAWRVGGTWYTSREALDAFREACTPKDVAPMVETPDQYKRRAEAAMERLRRRGLKV
jgi:hypothetical protein